MKIGKIFNNNAVMAKDNNNREIVLIGCGLAFKKKVGDEIDEALIEKTFTLKEKIHLKSLKCFWKIYRQNKYPYATIL